jgi:hypothetical protein
MTIMLLTGKTFLILFLAIIYISTFALRPGDEKISIDSLKKHLMILSEDSLKGRGTGSEGALLTANYIAGKLTKYNLIPAGTDNSFFQQIQLRGVTVNQNSEFRITHSGNTEELKMEKDFLVYSSAVDPYFPTELPLVFAGYGIIAPEFDYNDYQFIDIENKIAVILLGEPYSEDASYFDGLSTTLYSSIETKQRLALSRGAKGIIFIPNWFDNEFKEWDYYVRQYSFEEVYPAYLRSAIFSVFINPLKVAKLFAGNPVTYEEILHMEKTGAMKSFTLEGTVKFNIKAKTRYFTSPNVIAIKEGNDPGLKNSYIILSAHYDHLGIGKAVNGDSVYNGFIDNASGVSALLEIARCLSTLKTKRSVLFLFTTAEEKGLLGSSYYCDHPVFPLYKTIANINIDGLAFQGDFKNIIPLGAEYSTLNEMIDLALKEFRISKTSKSEIVNRQESFSSSDQFSFAKAGIPSVIIVEDINSPGANDEVLSEKMNRWMKEVYHSPFDNKNQFVDFEAMLKHTEIIFSFCKYLADSEEEPAWNEATPFYSVQLRNKAEKK